MAAVSILCGRDVYRPSNPRPIGGVGGGGLEAGGSLKTEVPRLRPHYCYMGLTIFLANAKLTLDCNQFTFGAIHAGYM